MSKHGTESRINLGFVGVANMGTYNLKGFIAREDVRVAAVCDVDRQHLAKAKALVDEHYGNAACRTFADFRKLDRLHPQPEINGMPTRSRTPFRNLLPFGQHCHETGTGSDMGPGDGVVPERRRGQRTDTAPHA